MSHEIYNQILNHIDTDVIGTIWFSKQPVKEESELHKVFDYLVDGSLYKFVKYLQDNDVNVEQENNFFISNSFDTPFILFNVCTTKDFSKKDFEDFKMILEKLDTGDKKGLAVVYPKDFKLPDSIKKSSFNLKKFDY